jgi:hypothetical protein
VAAAAAALLLLLLLLAVLPAIPLFGLKKGLLGPTHPLFAGVLSGAADAIATGAATTAAGQCQGPVCALLPMLVTLVKPYSGGCTGENMCRVFGGGGGKSVERLDPPKTDKTVARDAVAGVSSRFM